MSTAVVHTYSWEPFHGDIADRFQKLGRIAHRAIDRYRVERSARGTLFLRGWNAPSLTQPAMYGNGIFPDAECVAVDIVIASRLAFRERAARERLDSLQSFDTIYQEPIQ